MTWKHLAAMVLGASLICPVRSQEVKRPFQNAKEISFSLAITTPAAPIKQTDPVILTLVSTNITKQPQDLGFEMSHEPQFDWDIDVTSEDGKHTPLTPEGEYFFSGKFGIQGSYDRIGPGEHFIQSVDLRKLFRLGPGSYRVSLSEGQVVTNTARFQVVAAN